MKYQTHQKALQRSKEKMSKIIDKNLSQIDRVLLQWGKDGAKADNRDFLGFIGSNYLKLMIQADRIHKEWEKTLDDWKKEQERKKR